MFWVTHAGVHSEDTFWAQVKLSCWRPIVWCSCDTQTNFSCQKYKVEVQQSDDQGSPNRFLADSSHGTFVALSGCLWYVIAVDFQITHVSQETDHAFGFPDYL